MKENYLIKTYPKFDDEFDKLKKKCPSLENDFERLKTVLLYDLNNGDNYLNPDRYLQLQGLKVSFPVFKIKKFRCKSIPKGNRSGFRFIFILSRKHNLIYFTECYFKRKKKNENRDRIKYVCLNFEEFI